MARKGWNQLSDTYRGRLERAGVSRSVYESGGSLQSARGHGATPEKRLTSFENVPERYRSYAELRRDIVQLKIGIYGRQEGDQNKWLRRQLDNMAGMSKAKLEKARDALEIMVEQQLSWDEFREMYPEYDSDDWDWLGYYH